MGASGRIRRERESSQWHPPIRWEPTKAMDLRALRTASEDYTVWPLGSVTEPMVSRYFFRGERYDKRRYSVSRADPTW